MMNTIPLGMYLELHVKHVGCLACDRRTIRPIAFSVFRLVEGCFSCAWL